MPIKKTRTFFERDTQRPNAQSLRALTAVLPAIYAETRLARLPVAFAEALAQLFPGESHGIVVREFTQGHRTWYLQASPSAGAPPTPGLLSSFREFVPANPFQLTGAGTTLALVNVVTRASLHPLDRYQDFHRPLGAENDFDIGLRHREAVICAAVLRRHRDFTRQECGLMNALRPHLQQAWRNAEALEDIKARAAVAGASMPEWNPEPLEIRFGLTPRESEVLIWVAQGKTNGDVAAILGIRPNTVRTHLERVFAKLGVETRHAASLCALEVLRLPHGPQPPVAGPLRPIAACT
jgi:DNA-binding CsgD family transcriptional regulator